MRRGVDVRQVEWPVGRCQDRSTRQGRATTGPRDRPEARSGATSAVRAPARVANLEFREAQAQAPRGSPFHPAGGQPPLEILHVVLLVQGVVDGVQHETELQTEQFLLAGDLEVMSDTEAQQCARKTELILDRSRARGQ